MSTMVDHHKGALINAVVPYQSVSTTGPQSLYANFYGITNQRLPNKELTV